MFSPFQEKPGPPISPGHVGHAESLVPTGDKNAGPPPQGVSRFPQVRAYTLCHLCTIQSQIYYLCQNNKEDSKVETPSVFPTHNSSFISKCFTSDRRDVSSPYRVHSRIAFLPRRGRRNSIGDERGSRNDPSRATLLQGERKEGKKKASETRERRRGRGGGGWWLVAALGDETNAPFPRGKNYFRGLGTLLPLRLFSTDKTSGAAKRK